MQRVQSRAPASFKPQVNDTEKRLGKLFDALNEDALRADTVSQLRELSEMLQNKDFEGAQSRILDVMKEGGGEGQVWMVSSVPLVVR